jgi:hypothetical protein
VVGEIVDRHRRQLRALAGPRRRSVRDDLAVRDHLALRPPFPILLGESRDSRSVVRWL